MYLQEYIALYILILDTTDYFTFAHISYDWTARFYFILFAKQNI